MVGAVLLGIVLGVAGVVAFNRVAPPAVAPAATPSASAATSAESAEKPVPATDSTAPAGSEGDDAGPEAVASSTVSGDSVE